MFKISLSELDAVLHSFYKITKFKAVLFNRSREVISSYPKGMCGFCIEVRRSPELSLGCKSCDHHGFDICDKTRKPYIYKCHLGITEAVAPIYHNNICMGYLMFGQIISGNADEVYALASLASQKYGLDLTEQMISEMTVSDEDYIRAAAEMLAMCASYLYTSEIIKKDTSILKGVISDFISENIGGEIHSEDICKKFYISRSKLYSISMDAFGMGISQYIAKLRTEKAKELLRNTDMPIYEVGAAVGITDANYFVRQFKRHTSVTPLAYRKKER